MRRSGRAIASTIPGSPAPDPTSTTWLPRGISAATATQFSRCRGQSRPASRGPIESTLDPCAGQPPGVAHRERQARPEDARRRVRAARSGESTAASGPGDIASGSDCAPWPAGRLTVSRRSGRHACAGRTTTKRCGSTPSDSLRKPAAAIASCTTLRSNAVIGAILTGSPVAMTCSAALVPSDGEIGTAARPVATDVEHQPAAHAGLPRDGEPGQLLQARRAPLRRGRRGAAGDPR